MDFPSSSQAPHPLRNPKHRHVARSAAKRESVQMLGSIKDLQLRFSQAGLVEHRPGAGAGVKASLDTLGEDDETENRPPGAEKNAGKERKPWKDIDMPRIDPTTARREARSLARRMRSIWDLDSTPSPATPASPHTPMTPSKKETDTRSMLIHTAQAVRRARTLALSAGPSRLLGMNGPRRVSSPAVGNPRPISKPRSSFSTPSRPNALPRAVSLGQPERKSSLGPLAEEIPDPITALRKAALDLLSGLRVLEERLRVTREVDPQSTSIFIHQPRDQTASPSLLSDSSVQNRERDASQEDTPPSSFRPLSSASCTSGMYSEPDIYAFDEDEDYNLNALAQDEETKHTFTWEERIIAEDREYRQLSVEAWEEEGRKVRDAAQKWVGIVEQIFAIDSAVISLPAWAEAEYHGTEQGM